MESDVEAALWASESESLLLRVGKRFGRVEPRQRMRDYVRGLLGPVGRKNSWQLAEHAGHATPYGLQRLLSWCQWDPDEIPRGYDWAAARLPAADDENGETPTHHRWVLARRSPARNWRRRGGREL